MFSPEGRVQCERPPPLTQSVKRRGSFSFPSARNRGDACRLRAPQPASILEVASRRDRRARSGVRRTREQPPDGPHPEHGRPYANRRVQR